jgi:hypothetical protein
MNAIDKPTRMALRRASGTRLAPMPKTQTSPNGAYLVAHACFACRKSFKLAPRNEPSRCPNCTSPLNEMGRSFKAPAARNLEQWAKVEALFKAGFRFYSYRSDNCPKLPSRLSEVDAFVRANPQHPWRVPPGV